MSDNTNGGYSPKPSSSSLGKPPSAAISRDHETCVDHATWSRLSNENNALRALIEGRREDLFSGLGGVQLQHSTMNLWLFPKEPS